MWLKIGLLLTLFSYLFWALERIKRRRRRGGCGGDCGGCGGCAAREKMIDDEK